MKPTASPPVPVWLFDEEQACTAFAYLSKHRHPAGCDFARRRFHASFRRLA